MDSLPLTLEDLKMRTMPTTFPDGTQVPSVPGDQFTRALEARMGRPLTQAEAAVADRMAAHGWCLSPIVHALREGFGLADQR